MGVDHELGPFHRVIDRVWFLHVRDLCGWPVGAVQITMIVRNVGREPGTHERFGRRRLFLSGQQQLTAQFEIFPAAARTEMTDSSGEAGGLGGGG